MADRKNRTIHPGHDVPASQACLFSGPGSEISVRIPSPAAGAVMRIAIHADLRSDAGSGGIRTFLGALIKALGELQDGPEEYVILGPDRGHEWLLDLLGPNQSLVRLPGSPAALLRRIMNKARRAVQSSRAARAVSSLFHDGHDGPYSYRALTGGSHGLSLSNGFIA